MEKSLKQRQQTENYNLYTLVDKNVDKNVDTDTDCTDDTDDNIGLILKT